jgi:hypothetical protein
MKAEYLLKGNDGHRKEIRLVKKLGRLVYKKGRANQRRRRLFWKRHTSRDGQ